MTKLDRRRFLSRSALALGAVGAAGVGVSARDQRPQAATVDEGTADAAGIHERVGFDGAVQAGILQPPQAHAIFAALDAVAPDASALAGALQGLSYRARVLAGGGATSALEPDAPALDCGVLGPVIAPDALTVTIGFGASLFDGRFDLAARRPAWLTAMPRFAVDDDLDPARTHGDVVLQICGGHRDTVTHALRELLRVVRGCLVLRWIEHGFQGARRGPSRRSSARNLFAFRDGTENPDTADDELMHRLVWSREGEPGWAAGGTYQVIRTIRMQVEFWDRIGLREQERIIGRHRDSGAPLGGSDEHQDPRLDLDPHGRRIPLDAHIRLANPRTPETAAQRILRRGYNYDRGFDDAGALDQGLVFVSFNRHPERQFAAIQRRLDGEPLSDYVRPVGGGYFFVAPGTGGRDGWIGERLFSG